MQDRLPTYPGRVTLTPVSGNTYDMVMADEPTVVGTPLNKATFLTDETAALFGLSGVAVPDNVLSVLSPLAAYWWRRDTYSFPERYTAAHSQSLGGTVTYTYGDSYGYVLGDGPGDWYAFTINNPQTITVTADDAGAATLQSNLNGKYFFRDATPYQLYKADANAVWSYSGSVFTCSLTETWARAIPSLDATEYVMDTDQMAHPANGADGNYWYTLLDRAIDTQMFGNCKIELVSYVGTDTYGSANPNSLTFSFAPKMVMLIGARSVSTPASFDYYFGQERGGSADRYTFVMYPTLLSAGGTTPHGFKGGVSTTYSYGSASNGGKTISWYNAASAAEQFNAAGTTYYILAIG